MTMGDRIKELRTEAGMTQEELADKLGMQKSAIAKYENGRVENIKQSTIRKNGIISVNKEDEI
jgi:repressor LexA